MCDLGWIVARDEKLVSHHVRALRTAGLASSRREGKMVLYALTERGRGLLAAVAATGAASTVSAPVELPLAVPVAAPRPSPRSRPERYRELARRVRWLSWLSLGAMSVEGFVALAGRHPGRDRSRSSASAWTP